MHQPDVTVFDYLPIRDGDRTSGMLHKRKREIYCEGLIL